MPSRTRSCKSTQALKENIDASTKGKRKPATKAKNPSRKVLADKTNSASDNESIEIPKKDVTKTTLVSKVSKINNAERPRRDRRLPNRFVGNQVLVNLSNSKDKQSFTPVSQSSTKLTDNSSKTPVKTTVTPSEAARPKRISRLPSKFEDQLVSPNKFVPVHPVHASTPIVQSKTKYTAQERKQNYKSSNNNDLHKDISGKKVKSNTVKSLDLKQGRSLRTRRVNADTKVTEKHISTKKSTANNKSTSFTKFSPKKDIPHFKPNKAKDFSFRIFESRKQADNEKHDLDVYEFTYDPSEEPPPQKKKKKVVRKKPSKPKTVIVKGNYNLNLSKALSALTSTVTKKSAQRAAANKSSVANNVSESTTIKNVAEQPVPPTNETNINKNKHVMSIRVEDIAADVQPSLDHAEHINYSPINSPMRPITPTHPSHRDDTQPRPIAHDDPLNLKDTVSFFDDQPIASSSMNVSVRHPQASPWRVEFENLPIRWHANSYTKANMTPAVECSFIDFDTNKKKHVYTNIVPQAIETLQDLVNNSEPNLKQASIISFIKEKAEMSAKKKRERSATPISNIFDDLIKSSEFDKTPRKVVTPRKGGNNTSKYNTDTENVSLEMEENTREHLKRKNDCELNVVPTKTPRKEKGHENTFFGFDDSEDVENISPKKVNQRVKSLRPKARAVLKEINKQAGPTRAVVPTGTKGKVNSEVVAKLYEEMKAAEPAPVFLEKEVENLKVTSVDQEINNEDSESVHLFEDIEFIHHLKEHRKSYGKAKKVAFRQTSTSDSETQDNDNTKKAVNSSDEDDLLDLTYEIPAAKQKRTINKKKQTKKEKQSKKEDKEAEEWAAGFNSMCEEVNEFPLLVE